MAESLSEPRGFVSVRGTPLRRIVLFCRVQSSDKVVDRQSGAYGDHGSLFSRVCVRVFEGKGLDAMIPSSAFAMNATAQA